MGTWQGPAASWGTSGDPKWEMWAAFHTCTQRICLSQVVPAPDLSYILTELGEVPLSGFFLLFEAPCKLRVSKPSASQPHPALPGMLSSTFPVPLEMKQNLQSIMELTYPRVHLWSFPSLEKTGKRNSRTKYPEMP